MTTAADAQSDLEVTTVASLIRMVRELEDKAPPAERDPRRRVSNRTVRYRTRAALRFWRAMW